MNRRIVNRALTLAAVGLPQMLAVSKVLAQAADAPKPPGFRAIQPPQQISGSSSGGIEVLDFFSYACHSCHTFEPELQAWTKSLPRDVAFRRVPVPFLPNAKIFQKTFYALESMGLLDSIHVAIFGAIHAEQLTLDSIENVTNFVVKNGADPIKFMAAFESKHVADLAASATKTVIDYGVNSIPSLAIHGRYMTSASLAGGRAKILPMVDSLVQQVRTSI